MKVLYIFSDSPQEWNCSTHRCQIPTLALRRAGHTADLIWIDDWIGHKHDDLTRAADIVIFQRNIFGGAIQAVFDWVNRGKVIALDLDDAYHLMTPATGSPSHDFWKYGKMTGQDGKPMTVNPIPLDFLDWGAKLATCITSPSKVICDDWKEVAKTYWLPNYLDSRIYRRVDVARPDPRAIYIGWGGSITHQRSWQESGIGPALKAIAREFPNVHVMVAGDPRLLNTIDVPPARKINMGWRPYSIFSELLSWFDIGVAPLAGEYDRRRSNIKGLEYSMMGIPWIATDYEPYRELTTGRLVENTTEAWYEALREYVVNLEGYKLVAHENIKLGMEWDIDANIDNLIRIYQTIIDEAVRL